MAYYKVKVPVCGYIETVVEAESEEQAIDHGMDTEIYNISEIHDLYTYQSLTDQFVEKPEICDAVAEEISEDCSSEEE